MILNKQDLINEIASAFSKPRNDENSRIPNYLCHPRLAFFVIPRLDRGISSNRRHCEE
ncbi:MAG: hypothetical protein MR964_06655 [Campylobacter sp.]|uniref:hypothetical protein n=1 Tax=Campylobacter sp. TaxID=205 RepID=UPI002AA7C79B|nr:hypothetical protein [Campylobacter sp.]MCI7023882.1 hypothetical protein [Campylobacter sp.]